MKWLKKKLKNHNKPMDQRIFIGNEFNTYICTNTDMIGIGH